MPGGGGAFADGVIDPTEGKREDWVTILFLTRDCLISKTPCKARREPQSTRVVLTSAAPPPPASKQPGRRNRLLRPVLGNDKYSCTLLSSCPPRAVPFRWSAHPQRACNALHLGDDRSSGCQGRTGNRDGAAFSPSSKAITNDNATTSFYLPYNKRNIWICFNCLAGLIWNTFGKNLWVDNNYLIQDC